MLIWWTVLCVLCQSSSAESSATYSLVVPRVAVRSSYFKAYLYTYRRVPQVKVSVTDDRSQLRHAFYLGVPATGTTTITVEVSKNWEEGSYQLGVTASDNSFNASASMYVIKKSLSVIIQLDKAVYKPSQNVSLRVLVVNSDLKPYDTYINVKIVDPQGNRIMEWLDEMTTTGVASFSFPLSDQPPLGTWTIYATALDQSTKKSFEVDKYTLPRFEVSFDLPTYVVTTQTVMYGSLIAKYTYGENVKGAASISFELNGRKLTKAFSVNGNQTFYLGSADLQLLGVISSAQSTLFVTANVTEALTGYKLSGNASVNIAAYDADVTFLPATGSFFKPGLNYTAYVKVAHPDGMLIGETGLTLSILAYYSTWAWVPVQTRRLISYLSYQETINVIYNVSAAVPDYGVVSVTFVAPSNGTTMLTLKATLNYKGQKVVASKTINSFRAHGSNNIRLSVLGNTEGLQSGDSLFLSTSILQPSTISHYLVIARGRIVSQGTLPATSSTFKVSLTTQNTPQSTVVAYVLGQDNEIVSDSVTVNVAGVFKNKIALAFMDTKGNNISEAKPADTVMLRVATDPYSLVGLLSVDKSVQLLKQGNDITQEQLKLEVLSYSALPLGYGTSSPLLDFVSPLWTGNEASSKEVFENAGISFTTDAWIEPLYVASPGGVLGVAKSFQPLVLSEVQAETQVSTADALQQTKPLYIRKSFPETWIWDLIPLGYSGIATISKNVPDSITSWMTTGFSINSQSGLTVTPTSSKFRVFQNLFLSIALPYSIVRGEQVAVKGLIFNYMEVQQNVTVRLFQSTDFNAWLEATNSTNAQNYSVNLPVAAEDGASFGIWIVPRTLGAIRISLVAFSSYGGDGVEVELLVKPEGIEQSYCLSDLTILQSYGSVSRTYSLQYPLSVVPGSKRIEVKISGDVLGPSISGLERLVQVPYGCGEQNMITFTPNIFVREYLESVGQLSKELESKTQKNMFKGYQQELTYRRKDGFFSAFGNSDDYGSTWLTAFVMKSFRQARKYLASSIDDGIIETAQDALLQQRYSRNGAFFELGRVIHFDMQGGSGNGLPLTAFVVIALLEDNTNSSEMNNYTSIAVALLERSLISIRDDPYALSIVAYALQLARSENASRASAMLEKLAVIEGDTMHWTRQKSYTVTSRCNYCPKRNGASEVEMTSYALLSYIQQRNITKATMIAKWLNSRRNILGGFSSTQDTVLALQSLSAYARLLHPDDTYLDFSFFADNFDPLPDINVTYSNAFLQQSALIPHPDSLTNLTVFAIGQGSAVTSVCVSYNTFNVSMEPLVDLLVATNLTSNAVNSVLLRTCARSSNSSEAAGGMGIMEIYLPSGFTVAEGAIDGSGIRRIDYADSSVSLYYDQFTPSWICATVNMLATFRVNGIKDSYVKAYSYYNPDQYRIATYSPFH